MNKFTSKLLRAMAIPTSRELDQIWYHGTPDPEAAKAIMTDGISPNKGIGRWEHGLEAVEDHIYLSSKDTATRYALGKWDDSGHDEDIPGFLFKVDGKDLVDIQPDEDEVGEIVRRVLTQGYYFEEDENWDFLLNLIKDTPQQIQDFIENFINTKNFIPKDTAQVGKMLLPFLTDDAKLEILKVCENVAHMGVIYPLDCMAIDKLNLNSESYRRGETRSYHQRKIIWRRGEPVPQHLDWEHIDALPKM